MDFNTAFRNPRSDLKAVSPRSDLGLRSTLSVGEKLTIFHLELKHEQEKTPRPPYGEWGADHRGMSPRWTASAFGSRSRPRNARKLSAMGREHPGSRISLKKRLPISRERIFPASSNTANASAESPSAHM